MCGGNAGSTDRKETLAAYGDLGQVFNQLSSTGKSLTSAGAGDTGAASKYYQSLLSGNPSAVSAATAPEANAITSQANQQKKEMSSFGNRTGGKVAAAQDLSSGTRGAIADVVAKERSGAAGGLTKLGTSETGQGISATEGAGETASSLGNLSVKSRELSQKIHDQAVEEWGNAISTILLGA